MPGLFDLIHQSNSLTSSVLSPSGYVNGGSAVNGTGNGSIVVTNNNATTPVIVGNSVTQGTSGTGAPATTQGAVLDPGTPTVPVTQETTSAQTPPASSTPHKNWYESWYVWAIVAAVLVGGYFFYQNSQK